MPLIKIKQDHPEVLERVRQQLAQALERARRGRATGAPEIAYAAFEYVHGHIGALYQHQLISGPLFEQLSAEVNAAEREASNGDCA